MSLKGFFGHLRTINRHRHKVIAHCAKAGILWQGLRHDLSKYSPTEFIPGVKYFQGTTPWRGCTTRGATAITSNTG